MFSPAEREYLRLVAEEPPEAARTRLSSAFPNPAYRRKLRWGIRRKAERSAQDWELYARASRRDAGLMPRVAPAPDAAVPLYSDPLVTLLVRVRRRLARRPAAQVPASPSRRGETR